MSRHSTGGRPVRIVVFGGIGSGKSTVGRLLAERGAVVIDADRVGHEVLERGGAAYERVAERWPSVVVDDRIDRARLAAIVFNDVDQLRELEAVTHPAISQRIRSLAAEESDRVVVVELPLVKGIVDDDWVRVFVDTPQDVRLQRTVNRGSTQEDVSRRMAAQPDRGEWVSHADHIIENDRDVRALERRVDELWELLTDDRE